ncbi:class I SAM-dependent methyltransferase [Kineococcus sp. NBC_00420]|uniref:class I SAM-dependent DNA methyltransferase n=1 Tax=Kineococcus sp. NBC_00420 TaxID=2903564 RepID=UPI002E1E8721
MTSQSASTASERPFYDAHAEAYDHFIVDPVTPWIDAVEAALTARGLTVRGLTVHDLNARGLNDATLLDAGCGTGRHAAAFSALGHEVTLLDASAKLLAIAARRCPTSPVHHDDVCNPSLSGPFDVVTCRGVLNDLTTDVERDAALRSFARLLRPGGLLALDVRDVERSRAGADGHPRTKTTTLNSGAVVIFTSRTVWCDDRLVVSERHEEVDSHGEMHVQEYLFTMRPWTSEEARDRLSSTGFEDVEVGPGVGGRSDRLFITATAG